MEYTRAMYPLYGIINPTFGIAPLWGYETGHGGHAKVRSVVGRGADRSY